MSLVLHAQFREALHGASAFGTVEPGHHGLRDAVPGAAIRWQLVHSAPITPVNPLPGRLDVVVYCDDEATTQLPRLERRGAGEAAVRRVRCILAWMG